MSRIPQPPSSRRSPSKSSVFPASKPTLTPAKPSSSPSPSPTLRKQTSTRSIKPSKSPVPPKSPVRRTAPIIDEPLPATKPLLSIREQIALKRAEAKKAQTIPRKGVDDSFGFAGLDDALPTVIDKKKQDEDEVDLGRWSVKESIERARTTGALNLASRALPCIPSALFEIHLGVKPEPLKSVPNEPPITTSSSDDVSATRRRGTQNNAPSWYEAQDLEVLKVWSNEIVEIQPEISMFGSLKNVDLHNNRLSTLPDSFADLTSLTNLDLSHNSFTSLPANLFALPNLTTLNLSHNELTALPFRAPFDIPGASPLARTTDRRGEWFSQSITRATAPLPRLTTLDISHNHIFASAIEHSHVSSLPSQLAKLDLSVNPLGNSVSLLQALACLERLRELRLEHAEIGNDSFPVDILSSLGDSSIPFRVLKLLDLGETHVTLPAIEASFRRPYVQQEIEFEVTTEEPRDGTLQIILGKRVVKEAWEVEAERRAKARVTKHGGAGAEEGLNIGARPASASRSDLRTMKEVVKETWEIEAEQGMLTEGAKRRARAAAAAQSSATSSGPPPPSAPGSPRKRAVIEKEPWEIEAEQGLLTEGARRRARAAALAAANPQTMHKAPSPTPSGKSPSPTPLNASSVLFNAKFYDSQTQTLTLPASMPPSKAAHARSFSLGPSTWNSNGASSTASDLALAVPVPTLPLGAIITHPLAQTLKVLSLTNRRKDPSFSIPDVHDGSLFLPNLEELSLEGCSIANSVPVAREDPTENGGDEFSSRVSESLLPLIAKLFPSLRTLDLSYNALTSAALTKEALTSLILASSPEETDPLYMRKGLRHLRLRGNHLTGLEGFEDIADLFKGNRDCASWKLEELDIRDNEIGKLPPKLGLLPLDVFLVDGNVFRVPQRRVWEREGTKGLLREQFWKLGWFF
ncbi:uncharacterized protein FIBRA_02152 [Fibroporia radiculosa]|uniref:L domain-like protein n=1 Tax=Fibroporia radiculosa TaxID=599839 RepID=J4GMJ1_9APHY|nr:uncharacterized protein FIBRA_02152 [Fibroporia radiculosa]CCM00125.1 predicted protein [Fibroporia radiculosa]